LGEFGERDRRISSMFAKAVGEYLLVANRASIVEELAQALAAHRHVPQPTDLPEAGSWAYRQMRRTAESDADASGLNLVRGDVETMLVILDPRTGHLSMKMTTERDLNESPWKARDQFIAVRRTSAREWQGDFTFMPSEAAVEHMFTINAALGFGAFP
jgi:hypothetical protein